MSFLMKGLFEWMSCTSQHTKAFFLMLFLFYFLFLCILRNLLFQEGKNNRYNLYFLYSNKV